MAGRGQALAGMALGPVAVVGSLLLLAFLCRCHRFWASQSRLLPHAAAYVPFRQLRAMLAGTELAAAQAGILRLLEVGARVRESVRRVRVQLPQACGAMTHWGRVVGAAG